MLEIEEKSVTDDKFSGKLSKTLATVLDIDFEVGA